MRLVIGAGLLSAVALCFAVAKMRREEPLTEGLWEITTRKFVGMPLREEGPAQISKECVSNGWLQKQAELNRQMSEAFGEGSCEEITSEVTDNVWRATVRCESDGNLTEIEHEIVFSGTTMRGEVDATGVADGKAGRGVYRSTGKWLGQC